LQVLTPPRRRVDDRRIERPSLDALVVGRPTFSAGVAVHRVSEDAHTTIARADGALYEAKANGRNRIEVARSEILPPQLARRRDVEATA
jgi:GGDEF domain-containing protein